MDIIQTLEKEQMEKLKKDIPAFKTGDTKSKKGIVNVFKFSKAFALPVITMV